VTSSRDTVLGRVRQALGKTRADPAALTEAQAYIDAHARGPVPAFDADRVSRFIRRAGDMESTVARVADRNDIPSAVAGYLNQLSTLSGLGLGSRLGADGSHRGVCWPEFADLDWARSGLNVEVRPTIGDDLLGITGVFCAIAETGTLVVVAGAETPSATTLLPETHVAIVPASRIVDTMEDAFALIRLELGRVPRAINLISGPSRTGDIEQTIVLGAHGPFRVHILVMDAGDALPFAESLENGASPR
jgi:L-lactate dehydrogenase complex protein LldG